MSAPIKLLIVDDHQMFLDGLVMVLERQQRHTCLRASTIHSALDLLRQHDDIELVLLDLNFPGGDGVELFAGFVKLPPILVMSASEDTAHIQRALKAGARGFIGKDADSQQLSNAIEQILSGATYLESHVQQAIDHSDNPFLDPVIRGLCQKHTITEGNYRVLLLMSEGLTNRQIAAKLKVSTETIKSHTKQLYASLQVNNRMGAVNQAKQLGLIA